MSRITVPTSGLYEVSATMRPPAGAPKTIVAVYRGNPYRESDAELVYGEDIVRQGVTIYSNSGPVPIDTSAPALSVEVGTAPA